MTRTLSFRRTNRFTHRTPPPNSCCELFFQMIYSFPPARGRATHELVQLAHTSVHWEEPCCTVVVAAAAAAVVVENEYFNLQTKRNFCPSLTGFLASFCPAPSPLSEQTI